MKSRSEELASYVSLSPEGLTTLAGMLDQSIQESTRLRKERGNRRNGNILHGSIREGVILAAENSLHLKSQGITITSGSNDGILVSVKGAPTSFRLTHRPKRARPADRFLEEPEGEAGTLFPAPVGHLRLFYTVADGRLGQLTLARTLSDPRNYFLDCQIMGEVPIPSLVQLVNTATDVETRNDADDLSGLIRNKSHHIRFDEESTTDAETGSGAANAG